MASVNAELATGSVMRDSVNVRKCSHTPLGQVHRRVMQAKELHEY